MIEEFEVLLIGDTGKPDLHGKDKVLDLLQRSLPQSEKSAVIFLGDNIYPKGLPAEHDSLRTISEKRINAQLEIIKNYKGKLIFLSGNHDWNKGKEDGFSYLIRQENYVNEYLGQNVFYPEKGLPGPVEIKVNEYITIIAINTQWFIQSGYVPKGKEHNCIKNEREFLMAFNRMLEKNKGKRILVLGHLPVYSDALHGGKYLLKHHIFPLTIYSKKGKYFPLPIIGSLLPLYRKYFGAKEDISHPMYAKLRKLLKESFKGHSNIIYAAGHEHNLQHIRRYNNHYLISGAGSKLSFVNPGKYARFAMSKKGFFKLVFRSDLSVSAQVWVVDDKHKEGYRAYNRRIIRGIH